MTIRTSSTGPDVSPRPGPDDGPLALSSRFSGRRAVVTGASRGIGRAIAVALALEGANVLLLGRSEPDLRTVALAGGARCTPLVADLASDDSLRQAIGSVVDSKEPVDLFVHCGGQYVRGTIEDTPANEMDAQYMLSVRAPYLIVQLLLPLLRAGASDIVFVGSTARPRSGTGAFTAGQAAQLALVHTLREELGGDDIRVLCVFPGRTATPRQAQIFRLEGRANDYQPQRLLQPTDVSAVTLDALSLPRRAEVTEIRLRPAEATY